MKQKLIITLSILILMLFIKRVNAQYIRTVAGNHTSGYSPDGVNAINCKFSSLTGIVTDDKGNIYVSDNANYVVRKIALNGTVKTIAGIPASPGYSGDGGSATNAKLFLPYGLALDKRGNLYIADDGNSAIRKVDTNGIISTFAGQGIWGHSGDGGPATAARINGGMGLAFDKLGNLFIADGNTCIRKVDTNNIITTFAGSTVYGYSGDGGAATAASFAGPQSVAVDSLGNVFVCDATNQVIRKISYSGVITTIAGTHTPGFSGDGGLATMASVKNPTGIILDGNGNLIFCDEGNNRIRKIDTTGHISTIAGSWFAGYSGDGGKAIYAALNAPSNIFITGVSLVSFFQYRYMLI